MLRGVGGNMKEIFRRPPKCKASKFGTLATTICFLQPRKIDKKKVM